MAADLEIQALILFSGYNHQGHRRQGRSCQQARVPEFSLSGKNWV